MINRKILYGYQIDQGQLKRNEGEASTVCRIFTLYLSGGSYQRIADTLNQEAIPFSAEAPLWNKHKVKRLLENPRYTGADGYPAIIDAEQFQAVQLRIREKTSGTVHRGGHQVDPLRSFLRCQACGLRLHSRVEGKKLYFRCPGCQVRITIELSELLRQVSAQLQTHQAEGKAAYLPSEEVMRLTNAVNRGLERPDNPQAVISLILAGISARYDCCPDTAQYETVCRPDQMDWDHLARTVSYINISADKHIQVVFRIITGNGGHGNDTDSIGV